MSRLPLALRRQRRALQRHRRVTAAGLAAAAVLVGLQSVRPPDAATVPVLAAAHDLTAATVLAESDLTTVRLPPDAVPAGAMPDVDALAGRRLAGPVGRGEVVTSARLVGPALVAGFGTGVVGAPLRVADPAAVRLLRSGDRVDVLAAAVTGDRVGAADVVARDAPVVVVPGPEEDGGAVEGALLVLAVPPATAAVLAGAAVTARLSVVLRP